MSKAEHIEKINSYLNDGLVQFPASTPSNLESNGVAIAEFRTWTEIIKSSLDAIGQAGKMNLLPEGVLNSIASNIEAIRLYVTKFDDPNRPDVDNHFANAVNIAETLLSQVAPYLNLIDSLNYAYLKNTTSQVLEDAEKAIADRKKTLDALSTSTKKLQKKTQSILKGTSSGVLSDNFGQLSNNWWNWGLLFVSLFISLFAFVQLLKQSSHLTNELITALSANSLDYRVFLAKWSLSLPYLLLLSIGLLEARSRIRLRDIYLFRKGVAGSLDGYTEVLLNKAEAIRESKERSAARRVVIEFMINSMLELSKSPSVKIEKQRVGLKLKDIAEADVSNG